MRRSSRYLLAVAAVACLVGALRFLPQLGVPRGLADFCGGLAVGLLIGVLMTWVGAPTSPGQR